MHVRAPLRGHGAFREGGRADGAVGGRKTWLANAQGALLATFDGEREVKIFGNHLLIEPTASEEADRALAFEIYNGAGQRVAASEPAHKRYGEGADHVGRLAPGPASR